jgi:SAM-dependent methyltransferase
MDNCRSIWDTRYGKDRKSGQQHEGEFWLLNWLHLAPHGKSRRALDLGCGSGFNAKPLLESGFEVFAMDFSERALALCRRNAPDVIGVLADIQDGLPFACNKFDLVVADLSLHYFTTAVTATVIREIADTLVSGGLFAARFNSTNDVNYGARDGIAFTEDSNMFLVDGIRKRFFTRSCFDPIIGPQWSVVSLAEKSTVRYGPEKVFWEIICIRQG